MPQNEIKELQRDITREREAIDEFLETVRLEVKQYLRGPDHAKLVARYAAYGEMEKDILGSDADCTPIHLICYSLCRGGY